MSVDRRAHSKFWLYCVITCLALCGIASAQKYVQTNLVSDIPGLAATPDPNLVNAWGISFSATSPLCIADNDTGLSTLYTGAGGIVPLVVTVPLPKGATATHSAPTGIVFSGSAQAFQVTANGVTGNSAF